MDIGRLIRNAGHSVTYRDARGALREVQAGGEDDYLEVSPRILEEKDGEVVLALHIRNRGARTIRLVEAAVLDVCARRGGALALGGGPTLWTMLQSPLDAGVRDLCIPIFDARKAHYSSLDYAVIGNRCSRSFVLMGFVGPSEQDGRIALALDEHRFVFERLRALAGFAERALAPGEAIESAALCVCATDAPKAALAHYVQRLTERSEMRRSSADIVGWSTWDYYQANVTEDDVLENVRWLSERRGTLPVRVIQIDHGFHRREGDWVETNERFAHGLKWISGRIRSEGFIPGLWLCPFLVAPDSAVYRAHPDWVLCDASGVPVEMSGYASPRVYGLDGSIPAVQDWLRDLARCVTGDLGFGYVKLDGANGQVLSSRCRPRHGEMSPGAAAQTGLAAFREGMALGAFLLNAFGPRISLGICDGMRVGDDVGGRWDGTRIAKHHGERDRFNGPGEILRGIAATMNHFYLHKKAWVNDPDYLVVRQEGCNSELTHEEARAWASVIGLSNGLVMLGDKLPLLRPERVGIIEKVLPHCRHAAEPVDFFEKNVPSFYAMDAAFSRGGKPWKVLCVLNPDYPPRERSYTLPLAALGLSPEKEYCLFDFWNCRYMGTIRESLTVPALAAHDCRVFRLTEADTVPQVVGSDIHISMGEAEIEGVEADGRGIVIHTSALGRSGNVFLRGPEGWMPQGASPAHNGAFCLPVTLDAREIVVKYAHA